MGPRLCGKPRPLLNSSRHRDVVCGSRSRHLPQPLAPSDGSWSTVTVTRLGLVLLLAAVPVLAGSEDPPPAPQQAVLQTGWGEIVLDLFPSVAPHHVEAFTRRVRDGSYNGTTFHRAVPRGIIQGGDPLTRDPAQFDRYGTGGLFELKAEFNQVSHTRGALSAVLVPGDPDSAGSQFFICVSDQVQLDGHYTVFGRVAEGLNTAEKISLLQADDQQRILERAEIRAAYLREGPPPEVPPFEGATASELARFRAVIRTNFGDLELEFFPDSAVEHVRRFLRLAKLGLYDGTRFHRIVPGFVVQGGSLSFRAEEVPEQYQALLTPLAAEFNRRKHVRGSVSMARTDDRDSALDSFFIALDTQPALDGQYTLFGQLTSGWPTLEQLEFLPLAGEAPVRPVVIEKVLVLEK